MSNLNRNKSGLFLMELIVVTLFFSAAAVISVRIFFAGESISKDSRLLTNAVIEAQNAAQLIKNDAGGMETFCSYYGVSIEGGKAIVYFDEAFVPCEHEEGAKIEMIVIQTQEEKIVESSINLVDAGSNKSVYSLETKTFLGRRRL